MSSENFEEMAPPMPPALKAITLTHVRYHRGDPLGLCLAWVSLIPVFISLGGFVSHFLFRREIQGLCFTLGLLISQFLNELVKSSVQQSRPETCALLEACDSHGWPSSHSQYMFFFATYLTLLCLKGTSGVVHRESRVFLAVLPWPFAVLTMYSRVYLGYHTVAQVINWLLCKIKLWNCLIDMHISSVNSILDANRITIQKLQDFAPYNFQYVNEEICKNRLDYIYMCSLLLYVC